MNWSRNRLLFGCIAAVYAAGLLALLPWAGLPGYSARALVGIYGLSICLASLCTVILLMRLYLREGSAHLLAFGGAYLVSALLAMGYALSFPGAYSDGQILGHDTTSVILFLCWRIGGAALLLTGIVLGVRESRPAPPERRAAWCTAVVGGSLAAVALCYFASVAWHMAPMQGGERYTPAIIAGCWLAAALSAAGVCIAFAARIERPVLVWVALVATASFTDLVLSTVAGARHTLGWYAARSSSVVSAYLLLVYLAIEFARELRSRREPARQFVYFAATALAIAAVMLRYFLVPWLGGTYPYATLFGAVAVAVWMGGWGPGVLTATLAFLLTNLYIQTPFAGFALGNVPDVLAFIIYCISCALIIALGHNMRTARERSRRAEERFRGSQEAAIQGYGMLRAVRDADGVVTDFVFDYINPRGAEFANRLPQDVLGRRLTEVLPGANGRALLDRLRAVHATGTPAEFQERYEEVGITGWFLNMVVKVDDGVAISFFDISQTRALQAELADRAHQLERADLNKGKFLATLSHELRNPLAPLRNGLAVLRHRVGREDASVVAMMDRQLTHMVRLVDDLLDVSRIDRGKMELRRDQVSVEQFIDSAIETARPQIEARGHELVVTRAPQPLRVLGDPVRLAQIVSNLLINAAKFTPANGRIELGVAETGTEVEIRVADNGVGINAGRLRDIFEMFVQLESHTSQGAGGLGLGLALVRSLVEMQGGRVEARSAGEGRGAEFIVCLPLVQASAAPAPSHPPVLRAVQSGNRIFAVDDNVDAAQTLAELLRAQGHEVDVFVDARSALAAAPARQPQVAFLDLNMPGMDGFELARQLRRTSFGAHMCLVALTGMGRESDVTQALDAGFDAHLTKPADPDKLLAFAGQRKAARA